MRNAIYFSIIMMPKKSHFTIFGIQIFLQNTCCSFILLGSCLQAKWMVTHYHKFRISTKWCLIFNKNVSYLWQVFNEPLGHFFHDLKYLPSFKPWNIIHGPFNTITRTASLHLNVFIISQISLNFALIK